MSELDLLRKIADLEARLARLESAGAPYTTTSAGAMTTPALNVGSATGATTGQVISSGEGRFQDAVEFGYYNSRAFVQGYKRSTAAYLAIDFYTGSGGPQATLDSSALSLKGGINLGTATTAPAGGLALQDGITAPAATAGAAKIYVDTADGDLKVIFGDGTIKTIATDT